MMTEATQSEINIEQLMSEIRDAVAKREAEGRTSLAGATLQLFEAMLANEEAFPAVNELTQLELHPEFVPNKNDHYHVNDLLQYHDSTFIWNAYRAILKRQPDESGLKQYLASLRSGRYNKVDILASLRFSDEGNSRGVQIEGLGRRPFLRRLYRVPVLGYALELLVSLLRLPSMIHSQRQFQEHVLAQQDLMASHFNQLSRTVFRMTESVSTEMAELTARRMTVTELQRQQVTALFREQRQVNDRLDKLSLEMRNRWNRIQAALQQTRDTSSGAGSAGLEDKLDELLVSFADEFRGSREEVKQGLRRYLPVLETSSINGRVLDLGCGRGEWLELLKEAGVEAEGVESSYTMFERTRNLGLEVVQADALTHLRSIPDASLKAVTAFHFVEHLPFATLVDVIDETRRVLRAGGLLIFETPNPKNLVVGACNFNSDPTHHKPIFPETLRFVLSQRGFANIRVEYVNPVPGSPFVDDNEMSRALDSWFFSGRDFAVIATKPQDAPATIE